MSTNDWHNCSIRRTRGRDPSVHLTDFVVYATQDAAQRAIEQAEILHLSLADQECFAQAVFSPPEMPAALKRAFARRSTLLSGRIREGLTGKAATQSVQEILDEELGQFAAEGK